MIVNKYLSQATGYSLKCMEVAQRQDSIYDYLKGKIKELPDSSICKQKFIGGLEVTPMIRIYKNKNTIPQTKALIDMNLEIYFADIPCSHFQ